MKLETHQQSREALLATIADTLAQDERVIAAWLTGSYARGKADAVSDIDLTVVIADAYGESLCRRNEMVTARPTAERLAFFCRFGEPANVHENNHNAPPGGTFTCVLYRSSAQVVDWVLVPHAQARRPLTSQLLCERAPIPFVLPPEPPAPALVVAQVTEQIAFFWMMATVVAKYLVRRDLGLAYCWLDELCQLLRYVEHSLKGEAHEPHWYPARTLPLPRSLEELKVTLVGLCDDMEKQMAAALGGGIVLQPAPRDEIETLLHLQE